MSLFLRDILSCFLQLKNCKIPRYGYVCDVETQLYYLNSRYYNPEVGRFINADAYVSTGQGLLGSNMFAYCRNNPVSRKDATGTDDISVTVDDDDNPLDDCGVYHRGGGAGGGGNSSFTSSASNGGKVNNSSQSYGGQKRTNTNSNGVGSFRNNLQKATGQNGEGQHAHHVYPKSMAPDFKKIGIEVNDVDNGAWWEAHSHLQNSYEYNQWWKAFFTLDDVTAADARALAGFLARLFGFDWPREN